MRGSAKKQSKAILSQILAIGESRHLAKENARRILKNRGETPTPHSIGRLIGIHSTGSYTSYLTRVATFIQFVKDEYDVRDAMRITEDHAAMFLEKVANERTFSTVQVYACALEKMCQGMEKISKQMVARGRRDKVQKFKWTESFDHIKKQKRDVEKTRYGDIIRPAPRDYDAPHLFVATLTGDFKTVAQLQLLCGTRVGEIMHIKKHQLKGRELRLTNTKGGRVRTVKLSIPLMDRLKRAFKMKRGGTDFRVHQNTYVAELHKAAEAAGETWHGTHGLRWNYARNRMSELLQTHHPEEARDILSKELGHSRREISSWYLRR